MRNVLKKKAPAAKVTSPGGYKTVAPPKSRKRRAMLSGPDIAASGGARILHHQTAR